MLSDDTKAQISAVRTLDKSLSKHMTDVARGLYKIETELMKLNTQLDALIKAVENSSDED